MVIPGLSLEP